MISNFFATFPAVSCATEPVFVDAPLQVPYNVILSNRIALERMPAWIQHADTKGAMGPDSPSIQGQGLRLAFDATSTDVLIAILSELRRLQGPLVHSAGSPSAPLFLDGMTYGEIYTSESAQENTQNLFLVNSQLTERYTEILLPLRAFLLAHTKVVSAQCGCSQDMP